ncbi:MAG: Obg family GTPase CgtA [Gammaproteobacteria bacterium WSBS_2016_MAG_OTU1]
MKKGFIDETTIVVVGGDGGNGIVSFLHERNNPHGGPNGGDGGKGGSVYIVADKHVKTLLELGRRRRIVARNGERGGGSNCHGGGGDDVILHAPVGTQINDADTGGLHADLVNDQETFMLSQGGRGGLGNTRFKSSTNRAPRRSTDGETGEERRFRLELRLLADVGLLGLPNAGKSSLLRAVSAAKPKVAAYPFTTIAPQLGVIESDEGATVTVADVPGLIRGAASGAGLGNRFLRHLARTALLCHVVDMSSADPVADCIEVQTELEACELPLQQKPRWLILSKADLLSVEAREECCALMQKQFPHFTSVHILSSINGEGVRSFSNTLLEYYANSTE